MKISVIIPTFNEGKILRKSLGRLKKGINLEIIVVDGGSLDKTVTIAKEFTQKIFLTTKGRAIQMNEGARHAGGDILLFLHADSVIASGGLGKIVPAMIGLQAVGGAFQLAFDTDNVLLHMIAWLANLRTSITQVPYGDQGIFISRRTFEKMGGFNEIPIMEDVELAVRMKKEGKIILLKDKILTSPRRWEREGIFFTSLRNRVLMIAYFFGISPQRLANIYRIIR